LTEYSYLFKKFEALNSAWSADLISELMSSVGLRVLGGMDGASRETHGPRELTIVPFSTFLMGNDRGSRSVINLRVDGWCNEGWVVETNPIKDGHRSNMRMVLAATAFTSFLTTSFASKLVVTFAFLLVTSVLLLLKGGTVIRFPLYIGNPFSLPS
jgi:hypothetical protein